MKKVAKTEFANGTLTLYLPKDHNGNDVISVDNELNGRVEFGLRTKTFARGVWIKLVATNRIVSPVTNREIASYNLLQNEEFFHLDGLYETFVGFAEGDDDNGSLLELAHGRHKYPFTFKLPKYCPPSFCDGYTSISYTLTATLDSPSIPITASSASYNLVIDTVSESDCTKMLEHCTQNVIRNDRVLTCRPKDSEGYFLGRLMNFMRSPTYITMQGVSSRRSISSSPFNSTTNTNTNSNPAIFPFKDTTTEYKVKCNVYNVHTKQRVFVKAQLYVEVSMRESVEHTFTEDQYSNLQARTTNSSDTNGVKKCVLLKPGDLCRKYRLWSQLYGVTPVDADGNAISDSNNSGNHEITIKVPVNIDSKLKGRSLRNWPAPLPLKHDSGQITSHTMAGPLFRYRVLLKLSAVKGSTVETARKLICHPVFGEIYISPPMTPLPPVEPLLSSSLNLSGQTTSTTGTATAAVPPVSLASIPRSRNNSRSNLHVNGVAAVGQHLSNTDSGIENASAAAAAAAAAAVNVPSHRHRSSRTITTSVDDDTHGDLAPATEVSPPSVVTSSSTPTSTPRSVAQFTFPRPLSGRRNSSTNSNGHNSSGRENQENVHSNIMPQTAVSGREHKKDKRRGSKPSVFITSTSTSSASVAVPIVPKTPHAKPTTYAVRVQAELLSNGPAAALYDRNNADNEPVVITTPQRFAPIFRVGEATVIHGTPFVNVNTPDVTRVREENSESAMRSSRLLSSALGGYDNNSNSNSSSNNSGSNSLANTPRVVPSTPRAAVFSSSSPSVVTAAAVPAVGTLIDDNIFGDFDDDDDDDDDVEEEGANGRLNTLGVMQMMTPSAAIGLRGNASRVGGYGDALANENDDLSVYALRGNRLFV